MLSVLLYRLAVAGAIYALGNGFPLGPTIGDVVVAITGACIQLIFILIMSKIYEFLAEKLTDWGTIANLSSLFSFLLLFSLSLSLPSLRSFSLSSLSPSLSSHLINITHLHRASSNSDRV